jgi:hypothetical protein
MKPERVRTLVDIPAPLYRRQKAQAEGAGRRSGLLSAGADPAWDGVRCVTPRQPARQRVQFPLIRSQGPKVRLSGEQMYEHVEFP